jgi:hypothetical protein
MTIPRVGQLTALAFVAAIDDPARIRRSRDVGAYVSLVPKRYQSGEVDYVGGISKCGDRRVRTLLYEAANVMLTRDKGQFKLKEWANREAIKHAQGAHRSSAPPRHHHARDAPGRNRVRRSVGPGMREGVDNGVDFVASGQSPADCVFKQADLPIGPATCGDPQKAAVGTPDLDDLMPLAGEIPGG